MPEFDPEKVLAEEEIVEEAPTPSETGPAAPPAPEIGRRGLDGETILAVLDQVISPDQPGSPDLRRLCGTVIDISGVLDHLPSIDENTPMRTRLMVAGIAVGLYIAASLWQRRRLGGAVPLPPPTPPAPPPPPPTAPTPPSP